MNDIRKPRQIGRSVLAVLMGIVAGVAVTLATDFVLHAIHVFPAWDQRVPDGLLALATGVSNGIQRGSKLSDGAARTVQSHEACACWRRDWIYCEPGGRDCNLERRTAIPDSLVSDCVGIAGDSVCVGGRHASCEANRATYFVRS